MAKVTLNTIGSRFGSVDALNDNFDALETALENTLSRDGTTPNEMGADLDMNSHDIINVGTLYADEVVVDGVNLTDQVKAAADSAAAALVSEQNAKASEIAAANSATNAAASATFVNSAVGSVLPTVVRFSGDGVTKNFTLPVNPVFEENTLVFVDQLYQQKDTYTLSGTTLSFDVAPDVGTDNIEVQINSAVQISLEITDRTYVQTEIPTTGSTVYVNSVVNGVLGNVWLVLNPATNLDTLTVEFPGARFNGQTISITSTHIIRYMTTDGNGANVDSAVKVYAADSSHQYRYSSVTNSWYRCD